MKNLPHTRIPHAPGHFKPKPCPGAPLARPARSVPLARLVRAGLLALAACCALAGCAHFQAWGQKTSGSPATVGGAFNIPLGK